MAAHSTRPPITVMGIKAAQAAIAWVKRADKGTEERMEATNETARWADAKVQVLLRDALAWLLVMHMTELGFRPK